MSATSATGYRTALYLRISTDQGKQDADNQRLQLRRICEVQSWEIVTEYEDHESGGKSDRGQFRRMMLDASSRKWDPLVFWSLDRFTREGTLATLKYLELLEGWGIRWRSLTEPSIDSAGPFRDVVISLLASLAKQERIRIQERVRAGLERAKVKGTKSGRAIGRPKAVFDREQARRLRRDGHSWASIAREMVISLTAARRACRRSPFAFTRSAAWPLRQTHQIMPARKPRRKQMVSASRRPSPAPPLSAIPARCGQFIPRPTPQP
jgi:DNA invertase Pin-like site-specific DNA recombinase